MNKTVEKWSLALFFLLGTTILLKCYAAFVPWGIRYVYTSSIPVGFYLSKTYDGTPLASGQGVCFHANVKPWMLERKYLTPDEVICKRTLGLPGETVERRGDEQVICNAAGCTGVGLIQHVDTKGRPVSSAFAAPSVRIQQGQYYFGSNYHPHSFDSRYLGLVDQAAVTVRTWPIWTF